MNPDPLLPPVPTDAEVYAAFDGRNYALLARQFVISQPEVRLAVERHISLLAGVPPTASINLSASPSITRKLDSSTSTPANPLAAKTAPTNAISTDDGDSGTSATENTPVIPHSSMNNAAQLRATKFLLSLAMSLLMVALALISIHSLIPANTTASTAVMGITMGVMLLIQLCIAYPFLAL